MKKLVILTLALMLISSSIFATETRVMTMGMNNTVLIDDANISMFPGRVIEYPNLAIGEFGQYGDDFTKFGIMWQFDKENPWVLGTFFSTAPMMMPDDLSGGNLVNLGSLGNNRRVELYYGRMLGGNKFGFNFNYFRSSYKVDNSGGTDSQFEQKFGYYDFRFGLTEASGQWDLGMMIALGTWSDVATDGVKNTEPDGYLDFAAIGRYFYVGSPTYTWVPHVGVMYQKHGAKYNDAAGTLQETDKYTMLAFEAGWGLNYMPATNVLAVADVGIQYASWKGDYEPNGGTAAEEKENTLTLPYWKIGLDADVFSWMDVRFGATSDWHIMTFEQSSGGTTSNKWTDDYVQNETYLGFGFHWGRLHVDTYTDPEIFLEGFNFISGGSDDMNFQISALYEMF